MRANRMSRSTGDLMVFVLESLEENRWGLHKCRKARAYPLDGVQALVCVEREKKWPTDK